MADWDKAAGCKEFPERLKLLRTRRHMSQRVLGQLCGLGETAVNRYENTRIRPSIESVCILADFFGVSTDYLLGRSGYAE